MSSTADTAGEPDLAARFGFEPGQVVQEFGYDDDVDQALREAVENVTGEDLLDENDVEVVDAVLLWWREDDGDLVDALVDAGTNLGEGGFIWLLTPKSGRPGHVEPSDIEESAPTAGLHATSSISACREWSGTRLVTPKAGKR